MLRAEIAAAMLRRKAIGDDAKNSHGLGQPHRTSLSISVSQAELGKNVVQSPLLLGRSRLTSTTQAHHESINMFPVIQTAFQQDLAQDNATPQLNSESSGFSSFSHNLGQPFDRPRSILASTNRMQFDLDDR